DPHVPDPGRRRGDRPRRPRPAPGRVPDRGGGALRRAPRGRDAVRGAPGGRGREDGGGMNLDLASSGLVLAADDALEHIMPHHLWHLGGYSVTNHLLMLVLAAVLMLIVFPPPAPPKAGAPSGARNL